MPTFEEKVQERTTKPPPKKVLPSDLDLSPAEVVAAMADEGEPLPTGWAPLDRQLRRGGVTPGRIVTVGGPPFTGKTTILLQIAFCMSARAAVFGLFSDEGRAQAATRIGVMAGVPLERIESQPAKAAVEIENLLAERSITLRKPDTVYSTASHLIETIRETIAPALPVVVILDSVQTISIGAEEDGESPRLAARRFMATVRKWATEYHFIFLLSSQSNRASYRHKKGEENSYAIASFSESASVEYLSDLALVLGMPDDNDVISVDFVKNRLKGAADRFSVRYDSSSGQMVEIDAPAVDDANLRAREQAKAQEREKRYTAISERVERLLKKHGEMGTRELVRETGARRSDVLAVLQAMEDTGVLDSHRVRGKGGESVLWTLHRSGGGK